jgi:hypothetical protein
MIKTLRITSFVAAILAAGLFVLPMVYGFRSDEEIERFLSSKSVVDKFLEAVGGRSGGGEEQVSPLVEQAGFFAHYLDPPKPVRAEVPERKTDDPAPIPAPPRTSAKFKVVATVVNETRPEESRVLIDEPGKGLSWVKQSSEVSHLVIEEVKHGLVVVKGSKGPFEIPANPRPAERNLLEGSSTMPVSEALHPTLDSGRVEPTAAAEVSAPTAVTRREISEEDEAIAAKLFAELQALAQNRSGQGASEPSDTESTTGTSKIISEPVSTRISGEEAQRLNNLGEELKEVRRDPDGAEVLKKDRRSRLRDWRERRDRRNRMLREARKRGRERPARNTPDMPEEER